MAVRGWPLHGRGRARSGALVLAGVMLVALSACATARTPRDSRFVSGDQIALVQRALAEKGHAVPVTGRWDAPTHEALAAFQRDARLGATGVLDPRTARALGISPEEIDDDVLDPDYPFVNCRVNQTVDCQPGGW